MTAFRYGMSFYIWIGWYAVAWLTVFNKKIHVLCVCKCVSFYFFLYLNVADSFLLRQNLPVTCLLHARQLNFGWKFCLFGTVYGLSRCCWRMFSSFSWSRGIFVVFLHYIINDHIANHRTHALREKEGKKLRKKIVRWQQRRRGHASNKIYPDGQTAAAIYSMGKFFLFSRDTKKFTGVEWIYFYRENAHTYTHNQGIQTYIHTHTYKHTDRHNRKADK